MRILESTIDLVGIVLSCSNLVEILFLKSVICDIWLHFLHNVIFYLCIISRVAINGFRTFFIFAGGKEHMMKQWLSSLQN